MAYTVKKLSELSGVTVRALHFYEEINLLKPSYHGSNGYRYYEEKELLLLQQILFFKELGLTLNQIQRVLSQDEFNQIASLHSHKKSLKQKWEKLGVLLKTIDKTINHLEGKQKMESVEIFNGFHVDVIKKSSTKSSYYNAEEIVLKSVKDPTKSIDDVKSRGKEFYENMQDRANLIFKELSHFLEKGLKASSNEVQCIIKKHYSLAEENYNLSLEVYLALSQLYKEHPAFKKQLIAFHMGLPAFMSNAMVIFSHENLE
jgi:MerR family transcriptional regulator, thiopeptide resistance regulator